ncbi:MAG: DoxX family protein [Candidatus Omnitrophica bacterium]|nr:DoxX family protein [Candidatus Omnitrophota bacterium]
MKTTTSARLWFIARIVVGFVFAYAGFSKLLEPSANFEAVIMKYGIYPPQWVPWIAKVLPWLEWVLGSFLIVGYAPRFTGIGLGLLSLGFLITLASSELLVASGGSDCGCFGSLGFHLSIRQIFVVDLVSFLVALRVAFLREFPWTIHSLLSMDDTIENKKGDGR